MKWTILICCCLDWSPWAWAGTPAHAVPSIVTYRTDDIFENIKENVESAIIDRGMVIGRTLHAREMLDRTGPVNDGAVACASAWSRTPFPYLPATQTLQLRQSQECTFGRQRGGSGLGIMPPAGTTAGGIFASGGDL